MNQKNKQYLAKSSQTRTIKTILKEGLYPQAWLAAVISASAINAPQYWYNGIIGAVLLLHTLKNLKSYQAFCCGWQYSFLLFIISTYWTFISIHYYGNTSIGIAILLVLGLDALMALPMGICWALWARIPIMPLGTAWRYIVAFPACWLLAEWSTIWFATGFPWIISGYAHLYTPLAGWAPIFGVFALSMAVAITAGTCYYLITEKRLHPLCLIALSLWAVGYGLQTISWTKDSGKTLRVAVIQPHIPLWDKYNPYFTLLNQQHYLRLMEQHWDNTDLIVLPETAVPGHSSQDIAFINTLTATAKKNNVAVLLGVLEKEQQHGNTRYYNSAAMLGHDPGQVRKSKLVPFGEYIPLTEILRGLTPFFDLPLSALHAGHGKHQLITKGHKIDTFICYEIVFPDLVQDNLSDSGIILTISEDAWFGDSVAPYQHLRMAQMRALENERALIRGTNSGVSAITDERGRIQSQTSLMHSTTLRAEVSIRTGRTPFSNWGSTPVILLSVLLLLFSLLISRYDKQKYG